MENKEFESHEVMEKYKAAVENFAKTKSKFVFPNKDEKHAAIVLSNIFNSSNSIKICDDDLSGDIADISLELRNKIEEAVTAGKDVKFIIKDISHQDTEIYKLLSRLAKEHKNLVVVKAKEGFFEHVKDASEDIVSDKVAINFAIGDESSFRIEFPPKKEAGEQPRSAFCSFNNTEITSKLLNLFKDGFEDGTNIFPNESIK